MYTPDKEINPPSFYDNEIEDEHYFDCEYCDSPTESNELIIIEIDGHELSVCNSCKKFDEKI